MTDRIEPALTPEEWRCIRVQGALSFFGDRTDKVLRELHAARRIISKGAAREPGLPERIALANAALPDTDQRKITREWVAAIRSSAASIMSEWPAETETYRGATLLLSIADALAAYLPPE